MKVMSLVLLTVLATGTAYGGEPDAMYLQIDLMVGNRAVLADAGMMGGCYIRPGKDCKGLFYWSDDGSGVLVGSLINDLVPKPNFELLYSMTLTKEAGRDVLVGTAYAMQLSDEGEILGGRRTRIRQYLAPGEEIVLAQPVGRLGSGESIFLQISGERQKPEPADKSAEHPVTLISTQLQDGEECSQTRNWYSRPRDTYAFRTGFSLNEKNGAYEFLKYEVHVRLNYDDGSGWPTGDDAAGEPVKGRLSFDRKYIIDTLHYRHASFSPDVVYESGFKKDIEIVPGKMLKLIFPPDTPSVRGFDIEDTLIIVPR